MHSAKALAQFAPYLIGYLLAEEGGPRDAERDDKRRADLSSVLTK